MKVYLAENAGFCFGVKRAINLTLEAKRKNEGKIYTYGPLIHNPQAVSKFKEEGIIPVDDISKLGEKSTIIVRTHGVPPGKMKEFERQKYNIIDATCPFVKKAQKIVMNLIKEGYKVVIIGEIEHPEVIGIQGYAENNFLKKFMLFFR